MNFSVCNLSTLFDDPIAFGQMCTAVDLQVRNHAGDRWGRYGSVDQVASLADVPRGNCAIAVLDDPDQPDALGYHTEEGGLELAKIFVRPVFDNGGDMISSPYLSVSSVLSHEVLEALVDPFVNGWYDRGDGVLIAAELCDPVEGDSYVIETLGTPVQVSNFITPKWFDPEATGGTFDYLGKLTRPFAMTPGGYMVTNTSGRIDQVFGSKVPAWKRAMKEAARRFVRRSRRRAVA